MATADELRKAFEAVKAATGGAPANRIYVPATPENAAAIAAYESGEIDDAMMLAIMAGRACQLPTPPKDDAQG